MNFIISEVVSVPPEADINPGCAVASLPAVAVIQPCDEPE